MILKKNYILNAKPTIQILNNSITYLVTLFAPAIYFNCDFSCVLSMSKLQTEMVFCFENCSDIMWEKILVTEKNFWKLEAEGPAFVKKLRSLFEIFFWTVIVWKKNSNKFLFALVIYWNKLEQLKWQFEQIIEVYKPTETRQKIILIIFTWLHQLFF